MAIWAEYQNCDAQRAVEIDASEGKRALSFAGPLTKALSTTGLLGEYHWVRYHEYFCVSVSWSREPAGHFAC